MADPINVKVVDLRAEPPSRVLTAAFYGVKEMQRGETVVLLAPEEPTLIMQSLDLQMRNNLNWSVSQPEPGTWRVEVRHRLDVAPADIIDLLTRHHKSLDETFAQALRHVNAGNVGKAAPLLAEFASALRRHIEVENNLLAARLKLPKDPHGSDHLSVMLREHEEILAQVALIESCFKEGMPDAGEVQAFFAILSGTLAKHEYREENHLFPLWNAMLHQLSRDEAGELLAKVAEMLKGCVMSDE